MSDITISFLPLKGGPVENIKFPSAAGTNARTQALPHARVSLSIDGVPVHGKLAVGGKPVVLKKAGSNLVIEIAGQSNVELLGFYATEGAALAGDGWAFSAADGLAQSANGLSATAESHATSAATSAPPAAVADSVMTLGFLGTAVAGLTIAADTRPSPAPANPSAESQNQTLNVQSDALGGYSIAGLNETAHSIEYKVDALGAPEQIASFNASAGDTLVLDHTEFAALTDVFLQNVSLADMLSVFDSSTGEGPAQGSNVHLIYDLASGFLSYDPDGTTGPAAAWVIAELNDHALLNASNFVVI